MQQERRAMTQAKNGLEEKREEQLCQQKKVNVTSISIARCSINVQPTNDSCICAVILPSSRGVFSLLAVSCATACVVGDIRG